MNDKDKVFKLVMKAGEVLLHNGAEIFRVQETMEIMARAYGVDDLDVYAIANGLFATMHQDGKSQSTQVKYVPISQVHLGRVAAVNNLSRDIVAGNYTLDDAIIEIEKISNIPYSSNLARTFFAGIGSGCFCYILGGSAYDSVVSFIAGILLYLFLIQADKINLSKVLTITVGGSVVTLISNILFSLGLGDSLDHIIIGSIICLVPGVAITTSIRDFFNGDHLSGTIHLVDAVMVATCISVGVGIVLKAWNVIF